MNQSITHIYDITPRHFWMLVTKFFCKKIGRFTNNHNVIYNSMKAHDIFFHVFK